MAQDVVAAVRKYFNDSVLFGFGTAGLISLGMTSGIAAQRIPHPEDLSYLFFSYFGGTGAVVTGIMATYNAYRGLKLKQQNNFRNKKRI